MKKGIDNRLFVLLAAVFLVVNAVNAINKGGDFDVCLEAAGRLLRGAPLYEHSGITVGFVGPPAQALVFVPFTPLASVDPRAARLGWFGVNVLLLWYALTTWVAALSRDRDGVVPERPGGLTERSRDALFALAGVAYPLQTQFEHQNINIILLALGAYAAIALRRDRPTAAGVALGAAVALKIYPALALAWLVARRSWRVLSVAVMATVVLSVAPVVLRGTSGFADDVSAWRVIAGGGWPVRRANQSVLSMWGRYLLGEGPSGYGIVTGDAAVVLALTAVTGIVLVVPLLVLASRRASTERMCDELACVNAMAAVLSPIAWEHYWVAWFPVLFALRAHARDGRSKLARWSFWTGALLISGLSRPIVGSEGVRLVRAWSLMTWGGLITCGSLTALLWKGHRARGRAASKELAADS